eukprot:2226290-Rhodomonas_salina.1
MQTVPPAVEAVFCPVLQSRILALFQNVQPSKVEIIGGIKSIKIEDSWYPGSIVRAPGLQEVPLAASAGVDRVDLQLKPLAFKSTQYCCV